MPFLFHFLLLFPSIKKKKKNKQLGSPFHVPETCRQAVHPDSPFPEAFPRACPPLRTLGISWTRALLSSWSASHQPRGLVQRGRGCRRVLLLRGPHLLWAFSVKMAAPVLGADGPCGWPAVPSGRATTSPRGQALSCWHLPTPHLLTF